MWQLTNWVRRPTRSGPQARQLLKMSVRRLVVWSASGSVHSFPARSENSCSTIRGCAMRSAGSYSIADQIARTTQLPRVMSIQPPNQTAEADRGRHPGFPSFNVLAGGPGSLAERSAFAAVGAAGHEIRPEARMIVFAS